MEYSFLDLVYNKENQSVSEIMQELGVTVRYAEEKGYSRYWLAEHHNMVSVASVATSVLIGYAASQSQKIKVGSGGIMLPNHSPLVVAEQFGTLTHIYGKRIDLGLGRAPGTDQLTASFLNENFFKNAYSFPQNVSLLQQFFSEENQHSKVRAYVAEGTGVPLYILGSSTDSAGVAAAKGLPYVFAAHFSPSPMKTAFKIYEQEFKPSDQLQKPYKITCVNVIIGDTDEEARFLASTYLKMILNVIRNQFSKLKEPDMQFYENWSEQEKANIQNMTAGSFFGSKETVLQQLKEFIKNYEPSEIMISTPVYDLQKRLQSMNSFADIASKL